MRKFILIVLFQAAVLLLMAGSNSVVQAVGEPLILKTVPVDPRDFFMGDYVRLGYEIATIELQRVNHDFNDEFLTDYHGKKVSLVLEKQGYEHRVVGVYAKEPSLQPGQVVLYGKVSYIDGFENPKGKLHVDVGLERFYVPEGTGYDFEEMIRNREDVYVHAKVLNGKAVIEDLRKKD